MEAIIVDAKNHMQVTQKVVENVKSNQHRIDALEEDFKIVVPKVNSLYDVFVDKKEKLDRNMKVYMAFIATLALIPSVYLVIINFI